MCGRISLGSTAEAIAQILRVSGVPEVKPRWNIAPGQNILAIRLNENRERAPALLFWGLIPPWSKDRSISYKMINARAETVSEKPSFRVAYKSRRCLVPITGFYEWKRSEKKKIPFHIRKIDSSLFTVAGLWECWTDKASGEVVESCALLTTDSNSLLTPIHHRMPVIVGEKHYDEWLAGDSEHLMRLLLPYEWDGFEAIQVSDYVNNARHEGERCLEPVSYFGKDTLF
ncbi:Putative SOS response-associated peptidase YedK [Malonomonas rubra DSM 5091]|uniref:Abasic site processing protein n=1 Tax=Malonomonas rubra DSM 5091 TaxID=1122189 RepID=A0A1M6KYI5_MALRU|nr:SOS response-associated peptidase [Malonomonas rubra]SHJ64051.1 Putative SOS response-associated peptidase YedK [Malonomonas rubra DSM 5091]